MKVNVSHVAKLANLPLTDTEIKKFEIQLDETLTYVDSLAEINTKNIKPTAHVTGLENIVREDIAAKSLSQKQALSNAKNTTKGFIEVPALLEERS